MDAKRAISAAENRHVNIYQVPPGTLNGGYTALNSRYVDPNRVYILHIIRTGPPASHSRTNGGSGKRVNNEGLGFRVKGSRQTER